MGKKEIIRRYSVFILGLCTISLGVALATKADLGTSPLTSIPYTMSLILPQLTIGNWTIIYSMIMLAGHMLIMHKEYRKLVSVFHLLIIQSVVSFVFGYVIDFFMFCLTWFNPQMYIIKLSTLILACFVIAMGVFLQLIAKVTMLPPDMFINAVVKVTAKEYGKIRVIFDITMSSVAAILCLFFLGKLTGVREGTLICALTVGNIVRFYTKHLQSFNYFLLPTNKPNIGKAEKQH